MKKLLVIPIIGGAVAMSLVSGAGASSPKQTAATATPTTVPTPAATPTPAPPFNGPQRSVMVNFDTIQGAGGKPAPAVGCSQTNLFRQGQVVVFRLWGINAKLGGATLTPKNVSSITVTIPGLSDPLEFKYGNHGTVAFWAAPWFTTSSTPLGLVDFTITVKTKAAKYSGKKVKAITAKFTQQGLATPSRLTITP